MADESNPLLGGFGAGSFDALKIARLEQQKAQSAKQGGFEDQQAKKAAKDFEALLLKQMFDSMWSTVPKDSLLGGRDDATYRDMYNDALAKNIAENQGLGIAESIYKDMAKKR